MTVREAVRRSFNELPKVFHLLDLIKETRVKTERPMLTDGTITRRLRELRADQESIVNYEVIDNHKAIYRKIYMQYQYKMEL